MDRAASHYICESETKQDVSQTSQNEEGLAIKRLLALAETEFSCLLLPSNITTLVEFSMINANSTAVTGVCISVFLILVSLF